MSTPDPLAHLPLAERIAARAFTVAEAAAKVAGQPLLVAERDDALAAETVSQLDCASGHDLLRKALQDGQPLSYEVRAGICDVLRTLSLSDQPPWLDTPADATYDERVEAARWHASGWRGAVEQYRALLAEVRANGVAGTREGVST